MTSSLDSLEGDWDFGNFTLASVNCSSEEGTWMISNDGVSAMETNQKMINSVKLGKFL